MTPTTSSATAIVTGGRGLIGHAIVDALRPSNRTLSAGRGPQCDLQVDLAQQTPDFSLAAGGAWIHSAGATDEECKQDPSAAITRAAVATPKLISAAIDAGIEQFVYVSSAHVYGPLEGNIDETSPLNPVSLYAQCHFVAEQAFRQCAAKYNKSVLILRPCAVYGMPLSLDAFQRWSLIPYEFPRNALTQQKIEIRSSGLQSRNFVSTSWIAEIVREFLSSDSEETAGVINPIGADDITVREFAQRCKVACKQVADKDCDVSWLAASDSAAPAAFTYRSIYPCAVAKTSQLDDYLHDILKRLDHHAH